MAGYPHGKFNYKVEIDGLEAGDSQRLPVLMRPSM